MKRNKKLLREQSGSYFRGCDGSHLDPDFQTYKYVGDYLERDIDHAWEVIQVMVDTAPCNDKLGEFGAGHFEDAVKLYGTPLVDRIREHVFANERLAAALYFVRLTDEYEGYVALKALRVELGFDARDPWP